MRDTDIARLLPEIYQAAATPGSVLDGALAVMAALHRSIEDAIAEPAIYTDPRRAPDALLPILARWVSLGKYLDRRAESEGGRQARVEPEAGDLRELTAAAADLGRRRGTADALTRFLELATGLSGFSVSDQVADETGRIRPFHMRVRVPAAARSRMDLIERVLRTEKPAFTTCDIVIADDADHLTGE
jgi:phage tail-like protein